MNIYSHTISIFMHLNIWANFSVDIEEVKHLTRLNTKKPVTTYMETIT